MKHAIRVAALSMLLAAPAAAEFDGARVYWPLPKNFNIISASRFDGQANFNFTAFDRYQGSLDVSPDLWMLSYIRNVGLFGRSVLLQATLPYGSVDTDSSLPLGATNRFADGFGDLQVGATVNLIGAPELAVRDFIRWDEPFTAGIGVLASFPTGAYSGNEALNVGSNRYSVRLSAPMMWSITDWVPGNRTTLEVMPSVRWFSDNSNSLGSSISQDPLYAIEAHLTRDITRESFASVDYTYLNGAAQTLTGAVTGMNPGIDAHFLGLTFGFRVNDNLSMNLSHMQAVAGDIGGFAVNAAITKLQFSYSWHDVLEKRRDF